MNENIATIGMFDKHVKEEINRTKERRTASVWAENHRPTEEV